MNNMNNKRAVLITRQHPNLNFGQTLDVLSATRTNAVVRADDDNAKYTLDISEIWYSDRAHEYEAYNDALSKIKGWPWQTK